MIKVFFVVYFVFCLFWNVCPFCSCRNDSARHCAVLLLFYFVAHVRNTFSVVPLRWTFLPVGEFLCGWVSPSWRFSEFAPYTPECRVANVRPKKQSIVFCLFLCVCLLPPPLGCEIYQTFYSWLACPNLLFGCRIVAKICLSSAIVSGLISL